MEKISKLIFEKQQLNNAMLSNVFGGAGGGGSDCNTMCTSSTCNQASGKEDTRTVLTDDNGKVLYDHIIPQL